MVVLKTLHGRLQKKHPQTSLESAQAVCSRSLPANGEIAPDQLFELRAFQIQALEYWARDSGLIVPLAACRT